MYTKFININTNLIELRLYSLNGGNLCLKIS